VTFYLGPLLIAAGVTEISAQLVINIALSAWFFVTGLIGTFIIERLPRRLLFNMSNAFMIPLLALIGVLTKLYGSGNSSSGSIATVAVVFVFCGVYSIAWTPLATCYPPEVLNYPCRASGMAAFSFSAWAAVVFVAFIFPFGLQAIGWKFYILNAAWDIIQGGVIFLYYKETRGRTLEEIDEVFDGVRQSPETVNVYQQFLNK